MTALFRQASFLKDRIDSEGEKFLLSLSSELFISILPFQMTIWSLLIKKMRNNGVVTEIASRTVFKALKFKNEDKAEEKLQRVTVWKVIIETNHIQMGTFLLLVTIIPALVGLFDYNANFLWQGWRPVLAFFAVISIGGILFIIVLNYLRILARYQQFESDLINDQINQEMSD